MPLNQKLKISRVRGWGLKLHEIQGEIIILCGGTGIYPFSDLIDLLFKEYLVKTNHFFKDQILAKDPIVSKLSLFSNYCFKIYLAVDSLCEIHPITLQQC